MFRGILDWLALTRTERNVILFIAGAFVAGLAIRLYQETFPSRRVFDYTASDSTFAALSRAAVEGTAEPKQGGRLNLNTATPEELITLPGIGTVTAARIVSYRQENGRFRSVEELRKIRGISVRKLEQLKPLVTVTGTHP